MSAPDYDAIIIGGGIAGMCAAIRFELDLKRRNVLIIEREPEFGGTWEVNRYPGAGCDIPTRLYSFSFHQKKEWSEFYSKRNEISAYLREVARKYDLYSRAALRHESKTAKWDDVRKVWHVTYQSIVKGPDGQLPPPVTKTARVVISGMGVLSIPRDCDVPGAEDFEGPLFHTAKWDESVDLTGKNVVVLGNGCSAVQVVSTIASRVKKLTQIVRAKHWISPQPASPPFFLRVFQRYVPGWINFERKLVAFSAESHFIQADTFYGKGARQRYADVCLKYITEYAPEKYHKLLVPTSETTPVACKRRIFDESTHEGYIPCLNRPNVELTGVQAKRITKNSVILEDGTEVPADVIVYAGGFKIASAFHLQTRVEGPNGTLEEYWKRTKDPQAYRSCMVSEFPNLFLMGGPNSATGSSSVVLVHESLTEFITTVCKPLFAKNAKPTATVRPRREAEEKEQRWIQDSMAHKVYSSSTCGSWYTSETGRVTALAPTGQFTWFTRCRFPPLNKELEYKDIGTSRPSSQLSYWKQLGIALGRGEVWDPSNPSAYDRYIRYPYMVLLMRFWQFGSFFLDNFVVHWNWPANPKKLGYVNGKVAKQD